MKKKKRVKMKNGVAKWLRSPDGPKRKVIPDKKKKELDRPPERDWFESGSQFDD